MSRPLSQIRARMQDVLSSIQRRAAVRWWYKVGFGFLSICLIGAAKFDSLSEARGAIRHYTSRAEKAFQMGGPDTTLIFGPKQFVTTTNNVQVNFAEAVPAARPEFALIDSTGQVVWAPTPTNYTIQLRRVGGSLTTATVSVNGFQVATAADFASATYIERPVSLVPLGANTTVPLTISLKGAAGAGLIATIVGTPDQSVGIFGPKSYVKTPTTPTRYTDNFVLPSGTSGPYTISATASVAGTKATITLNGVQVIKDVDFGSNLTYVAKTVSALSANNTMVIDVRGNTNKTITVYISGLDKTPPTLTIAAPAPNFVTNAATVTVSGTSQDREETQVKVNGVIATMSGPQKTQYSATVPLDSGVNTLAIRATDRAGNYTDSTRTVTRDSQAPTLTVTTPADGSFTNQDAVTVAGTVSDASTVTVKVNGVSYPVGQGGAFTGSYQLAAGANFLTIEATDAPGNVTTQVIKVTQDRTPPALAVTAPSDGIYTNATAINVTGTASDAGTVSVKVNGTPVTLNPDGTFSHSLTLVAGSNAISVVATDGAANSTAVSRTVTQDREPPVTTLSIPILDANDPFTNADTAVVIVTATDASPVIVTLDGSALSVDANGQYIGRVPLVEGWNGFLIEVADVAGNRAFGVGVAILRDTQAPVINLTSPAEGAHFDTGPIVVSGSIQDSNEPKNFFSVLVNGVEACPSTEYDPNDPPPEGEPELPSCNFSTQVNLVPGSNTISIVAKDATGNTTTLTRTVTFGSPPPPPSPEALPPDTLVHAPAISASVVTTPFAGGEFLYSGPTPLQTGVVAGTIVPRRAAILRGRILDRDGVPLGGVEVTVLDHPEFGRTETRASGQYDMAVNGGGNLTLSYAKPGVLGALRSVNVPWQDYVLVHDVVLVAVDAQVTQVDLSGGTTGAQVARGSIQTDADGTRQATVLFPEGTTANMIMPDGSSQPLSSLHVRATEYTVGENGRRRMPAPLPPSSGYTYAVELTVDEASAAGATSVHFSQTVPFYVDNFLGFPVGVPVPVGVLDRARGVWVPQENGVIIKILGKTNGLADVDTNGDGVADDAGQLAARGITTEERARLDSLYETGRSLWRIPLAHFSAIDANFPVGNPNAAAASTGEPKSGGGDVPKESCVEQGRSSIECETQVLGERIALVGTPFALHYRSDRAPGRTLSNALEIPLTDSVVPAGLLRVMLEVSVAGRSFIDSFPAQPNLKHTFVWDGKDAYGRTMTGGQPVMVSVGYVYEQFYAVPADQARSFGLTCRGAADRPGFDVCKLPSSVSSRARDEEIVPRVWHGRIGSFGAAAAGLGGWTLDAHHAYDVSAKELYTGDGQRRRTEVIGPVITTVAGTGSIGHTGDGGAATLARLYFPYGVVATADGSLYITEYGNADLRRVGPDGVISTVATGFSIPTTMSADASGRVYFIDMGLEKAFRFTPARAGVAAKVETIAGGGSSSADGIPATQVVFYLISGVAAAPDGSLYITDKAAQLVWRVGTDGRATKFAGNGQYGFSGDGGPAMQAQLSDPYGPAVGLNGEVYILDGERIRRIGSDGIITTVAQDPRFAEGGIQLVVGPDGNIYISDYLDLRVHLLKPDGQLIEVAGISRDLPGAPDNSPATRLKMRSPWGISLGPDGSLYIADGEAHKVRVMRQALPGLSGLEIAIASQDGSTIDVFDATGLHLRTLDALTRVTLLTFGYDAIKQLTTVTDASNNVTSIERDAAGNPVTIIGPFGQRTALNLNTNGLLSKVTNPAGEPITFTYHPGGLLATLTDPRSHVTSFTYDSTGRLSRDQDAAGGALDYVRSDFEGGWEVTQTSTLGRVKKYRVEKLATGGEIRVGTDPAGLVDRTIDGPDGIPVVTTPDGTTTTTTLDRDLRVGMQAPIAGKTIITTPGGIVSTVTRGRRTVLLDPANPSSLISQMDSLIANGQTYRNNFVAATKTFTVVTPEGRVSMRQLDAQGRVVKDSTAGISSIAYQYDSRGRLATVRQAARTWTYTYGSDGRLESVSDPMSRSTGFGYDSSGRVIVRRLSDGRQVRYTYDGKGNLTSFVPPGRPAHGYGYTSVDKVEEYQPPAGSDGLTPTQYSYNLDRQLTRITRPDGGTIQFGYDTAGRLQSVTHPLDQVTYDYSTTNGNLTTITTAISTLGVTYDGSLVTGLTWAGAVSGSVGFGYDNNFRVTSLNVNGTNSVSLTFNRDGLLTGVGGLTISRNLSTGRVDSTRLQSVTTTGQLNNLGEWTHRSAKSAGTTLFDANYVRDSLARINQVTEMVSGVTTSRAFAYDSAGRLTQVRNNGVLSAMYEYDANGNRQRVVTPNGTTVSTYDDQDRMLTNGAATYSYTRNGELSTKAVGSDTTRYSYDALGNLRSVRLPDGTLIEYIVDGVNRRIGRKVNGVLVRGWLYQGQLTPIAELDGTGNVVTRFVYGTRANVPEYFIKNGTTYRLITDNLGSVRLVVDAATGAVAEQIDYDEWGNVIGDTNAGFQPFGYAGGLYDAATGLVRFGVRDYDPVVGRWTAKDPIGLNGGSLGLYRYVDNDPINQIDSRGTCPGSGGGDNDCAAKWASFALSAGGDAMFLTGIGAAAKFGLIAARSGMLAPVFSSAARRAFASEAFQRGKSASVNALEHRVTKGLASQKAVGELAEAMTGKLGIAQIQPTAEVENFGATSWHSLVPVLGTLEAGMDAWNCEW